MRCESDGFRRIPPESDGFNFIRRTSAENPPKIRRKSDGIPTDSDGSRRRHGTNPQNPPKSTEFGGFPLEILTIRRIPSEFRRNPPDSAGPASSSAPFGRNPPKIRRKSDGFQRSPTGSAGIRRNPTDSAECVRLVGQIREIRRNPTKSLAGAF